MIPLSLARIAEITGGTLQDTADPAAVVRGPVVIDSRQAAPGCLFAAVRGTRVDGHAFAAAAVAAGAVGVLAARPVPAPAVVVDDVVAALGRLARAVVDALPEVTVVAVTGSSGKTSTKDLLGGLAARLGPTVAPVGSYNNEIGHPLTVLRADAATRYLVLEVSARGLGHIAHLCRIAPPRIGVVLNVGSAHLGEFGDRQAIAQAKGELVEALPADGVAVLNADDPLVAGMAGRTRARVVTYGRASDADVRAVDVTLDEVGRPRFTLRTPEGEAQVALRLHGAHYVTNALAAAAVARELGMDPAATAEALGAVAAVSRWRMEVRERPDGVVVVNDAYNANPESVRAALDTLAVMARGRRAFAVLGQMAELGTESAARHEEVGRHAAEAGVTGLVAVGAEAAPILSGAAKSGSWDGEALPVPDAAAAVDALRARLRPGDVVLVKGSRVAGLERVAQALLGVEAAVGVAEPEQGGGAA